MILSPRPRARRADASAEKAADFQRALSVARNS
jgi:hypothetical protein